MNTAGGVGAAPVILVVEDDPHITEFVAEVLEDEGYRVALAAHGKDAITLLDTPEAVAPALILLDWNMPVMDAPAFLAAYRQRPAPRAPVVIMTAATNAYARCKEVDATDCLGKPFGIEHLLACVTRHAGDPGTLPTPK
jgi:CheY-like chemotaxis protein